jgi:hypothetical protein
MERLFFITFYLLNRKSVFKEIIRVKKSELHHSHCLDLDWNGKRPGITSDGNFSSYLIGRGMANPANKPISEKLPKWHFLTHACNYDFFWTK